MFENRKGSLLTTCLAASVGLHLIALYVFYTQPLFLQPALGKFFGKGSVATAIPLTDEDINLSEKNIALEEVFNQIVVLSSHRQLPFDIEGVTESYLPEQESGLLPLETTSELPAGKEIAEAPSFVPQLPAGELPVEAPLLLGDIAFPSLAPSVVYDKKPEAAFIDELRKNGAAYPQAETETFASLNVHYPPVPAQGTMAAPSPSTSVQPLLRSTELSLLPSLGELSAPTPPVADLPIASEPLTAFLRERPERQGRIPLPSLSAYAMPVGASHLEWSSDFAVELQTMQREEGDYLFSVTFTPKYDMRAKQMKQNLYFLIDRSHTIDKHRYATFKKATLRALSSLQEGDHFNIIVFDAKISKMSAKPIAYSKKSLQCAEEFLHKQEHGAYSTETDVYTALSKLVPDELAEEEMHTAILLSDGKSSLKLEKQRKLIHAWLAKDGHKMSLYTASVGEGNNLTFLDLLATVGRGSLLYSDTHTGFPRKLAKLVLDLRSPLAKEMTLSLTKQEKEAAIQLYTSALPAFFTSRPYTIYGTARELSGCTLILQGRSRDQLLTIKKEISLANAKKGTTSLPKEWAQQQAHLLYQDYVQKGDVALLNEARAVLQSAFRDRL